MRIEFVTFPKAEDDSPIIINYSAIQAIAPKGNHVAVLLGSEWVELNVTLDQFIKKCSGD